MDDPDADIRGTRVRTPCGAFGTVVGRDILGQRWRVRMDRDGRGELPSIYDPAELTPVEIRLASPLPPPLRSPRG